MALERAGQLAHASDRTNKSQSSQLNANVVMKGESVMIVCAMERLSGNKHSAHLSVIFG